MNKDKMSHKINWGKVFYKDKGIVIETLFGFKKVTINWDDIDFCSLTPSVKKINNEWKDFEGTKLDDLKYLEIKIALKNRHEILKGINLFSRIWFTLMLNLKALFGADDKPLPKEGVITIDVKLKTLSIEKEEFIEFLSRKTKFDLIVSFH